jgi:hypothetical protein
LDPYIRVPTPVAEKAWWIISATPPLRETIEMWPGSGFVKVKVSAHVGVGVDDSLAVGAKDSDAVLFGVGQTSLLNNRALRPDLGKAPAVEDDELYVLLPTIVNRLGHEPGRDDHVDDVNVSRNVQNRRIGFDTPNLVRLGINRIDWPLVPKIQQVLDHSITDVQFP